jgi:hypothetical protein
MSILHQSINSIDLVENIFIPEFLLEKEAGACLQTQKREHDP